MCVVYFFSLLVGVFCCLFLFIFFLLIIGDWVFLVFLCEYLFFVISVVLVDIKLGLGFL